MSWLVVVAALARRDLRVAVRQPGLWLLPLLFFVLAAVLLPLGLGPEQSVLRAVGPGALWLCALLAALLAHEGLFRSDREDGTLDLLLTSPYPLALLVGTRVALHWLLTGLPAVLVALPLAQLFVLTTQQTWILAATLLLGTPSVSLLSAIGAALVVGLNRGGVLLPLLILPLCVPVLIFASAAVRAAGVGLPVSAQLLLLGAYLALTIVLVPLACAVGLRAAGAEG